MHDVVSILKPEHFYRETHRCVYEAMLSLFAEGEPMDTITVPNELERRGLLERVGGDELFASLCNDVPADAPVNAGYYAGIVRDKAVQRKIVNVARQVDRDAHSNLFSSEDLLSTLEKHVFDMSLGNQAKEVQNVTQILDTVFHRIEQRKTNEFAGLQCGWPALDYMIGGLRKSKLIVVGARPSMGKTAFALNIADSVAIGQREPVLFFSLEMDDESLGQRLLSSRALVDGNKMISCKSINSDDENRLAAAYADLRGAPLYIDDTSNINVLQILSRARQIRMKGNLSLIVIDYLQLIDSEESRDSRQEQIAKISRRLKTLAREIEVPVIALSQLNRAVENREDRRPRLADLRESGAIEQDADLVLLLHRPDYYDPNDQPGIAEVIVAKNREGSTGMVKLFFARQHTRFNSLERHYGPEDVPQIGGY